MVTLRHRRGRNLPRPRGLCLGPQTYPQPGTRTQRASWRQAQPNSPLLGPQAAERGGAATGRAQGNTLAGEPPGRAASPASESGTGCRSCWPRASLLQPPGGRPAAQNAGGWPPERGSSGLGPVAPTQLCVQKTPLPARPSRVPRPGLAPSPTVTW